MTRAQICVLICVVAPPSSSSLTVTDVIALDFFFFSFPPTTCQICISGARPGGIRFKKAHSIFKNSFYHQLLHSEALWLQAVKLRVAAAVFALPDRLYFSFFFTRLLFSLTSRSIYSEDQLSALSVSGNFK